MSSGASLAPCIAVVGPANSGKSTLVHLLNRALNERKGAPLFCVVKGSPDGSGRYLFHSPELREALKSQIKGRWVDDTFETIRESIRNCRASLELVLVDSGGKHTPVNERILRGCSHYVVLATRFDDPAKEATEGMESWVEACTQAGLEPVATIRSLWKQGAVTASDSEPLEGSFRGDKDSPNDSTNAHLIEALVEKLLKLVVPRPRSGFVDLHLGRLWLQSDLDDIGGHGSELDRLSRTGTVVLSGGHTPTWVYLAAMHRVLSANGEAGISVFDPKVEEGLVGIPASLSPGDESPLADRLAVGWSCTPGILHFRIKTDDRFLRPGSHTALPFAPLPPQPPPQGPLATSGRLPIWIHLAYSRWLRSIAPDRGLGVWDAQSRGFYYVTGPNAPRFESAPPPSPPAEWTDEDNLEH